MNWWHKYRATKQIAAQRRKALNEALETFIDLAGNHARAVSGYAKKLRPALAQALEYLDAMAAAIPGPLRISPRAWKNDPAVNALFVEEVDLAPLFTRMGEAKEYFANERPKETYALLTMDRRERTVFTAGRKGAVMERDVPRTSVTFSNHRLMALAASEEETRAEIKVRALKILAEQARGEIDQAKTRERELAYLENLYKVKLSSMGDWVDDKLLHDAMAQFRNPSLADMEASLDQVRRELHEVRQVFYSGEAQLKTLERAMDRAPQNLEVRIVTTLLNEFSMITEEGSGEESHRLTLARITLGEERQREAVVVSFRFGDFK
jgi:hypothetical protein